LGLIFAIILGIGLNIYELQVSLQRTLEGFSRMNIALITTGGTIASVVETSIQPTAHSSAQTPLLLVEHFHQTHPAFGVTFDHFAPYAILSENLTHAHWKHLITTIESLDTALYDGIIITHGSDTLGYSAALLGLYFHDYALPIALVASNYPLSHPHANGHANFAAALFAMNALVTPLVFVPYQNPNSASVALYAALEMTQIGQLTDSVTTPLGAIGSYDGQNVTLLPYTKIALNAPFAPLFYSDFFTFTPYPSLSYERFAFQPNDVILHTLYHSGTLHSDTAIAFAQKCQANGVALYFAPMSATSTPYATTQALIDAGATLIVDTTIELSTVKLLLAYGNAWERDAIEHLLTQKLLVR